MITIKEIAKHLGVSPSTVSKALNGYGEIGQETALRVKQAARELGYHPNAAAQQLKTNRSHLLGVLFVDESRSGLTHEFFAAVLNSFKEAAEQFGYDIMFIPGSNGKAPLSYREHCLRRNCDGVAIACVDFSDPNVLDLMDSDIPIVSVDFSCAGRSSVVSDNTCGMADLVRYVHSMGHRRIALIHGENTAVTRQRLAAFHDTCDELGISNDDRIIREGRYHSAENSAAITRELLAMEDRPSCILYPDDYSYLGGMTEIERAGLSIPEDISVTGFDGIALTRVLRPRLTTVKQDAVTIGRKTAELLIEAIDDPSVYQPRTISIPTQLTIGKSVKRIDR